MNELELLILDQKNYLSGSLANSPQEVQKRQARIRELKFQNQAEVERELFSTGTSAQKAKYGPLVLRREWNQARVADGTWFKFSETDTANHTVGNWTCRGCAPPDATMQVVNWCPKFLDSMGLVGPEKYIEVFKRFNPDSRMCYAGLMHTQSTVTESAITFDRMCDSCGFRMTEVQQLKQNFEAFNVQADTGSDPKLEVTLNCTECQEALATLQPTEIDSDGNIPDKYKALVDAHWSLEHPSQLSLKPL